MPGEAHRACHRDQKHGVTQQPHHRIASPERDGDPGDVLRQAQPRADAAGVFGVDSWDTLCHVDAASGWGWTCRLARG